MTQMPLRFVRTRTKNIGVREYGWKLRQDIKGWLGCKKYIAKGLWRFLLKTRVLRNLLEQETIETYYYDDDKMKLVSEKMSDIILSIINMDYHPDDYCFVMGDVDFSEIMRCEPLLKNITVPTLEFWRQDNRGYRASYRGIPIHVVPYVEGVAAIPKVIVEKRD